MTNNEKLALLNTIEVIDSSACAGELECVYVEPTVTNKAILRLLGATEEEMRNYVDEPGECLDIVPFISNYVEYGWFEERLGGFLTHRPHEMTEEELAAEGDWPDSNDVMDEF